MGKQLIFPKDLASRQQAFMGGPLRGTEIPSPGTAGLTFDPNRMEDLGVNMQSTATNWWNNLMNHMDEIHKSEVVGKQLMLQNEIDTIKDDETKSAEYKLNRINTLQQGILELDKRKAEYQEDIDSSPVSKKFQGVMDAINMNGSARFLSGDHIMQLSEDLAGTLMYQIPQFASQAGSMALNMVPYVGPYLSFGATAASTYYFRKQESLAEVGDAYETRMMEWEQKFLRENPGVRPDSQVFNDAKEIAAKQARKGIMNLYDKNLSLMAQDIISSSLLLGRFGGAGRLFNTGSRMLNKGLYLGTNMASQYYGEGVYEEGSQYKWQKDYISGKLDKDKTLVKNWMDAMSTDIGEVAAGYFPNLLKTDDLSLTLDKNFNDAVERGGKAAMLFGGGMSMISAVGDQYKYRQVKNHLGENIDILKDQNNNEYNRMMYRLFDRGKIAEVNDAVDSYVKKGDITEEQGAAIKKDIESKGDIFRKLDSIFYTRGSFERNRRDPLTRLDAWLAATQIVDLENQLEDHESKVRAVKNEMTIGGEDITGTTFNKAMEAKTNDLKERIQFQKKRFKAITRGSTRSINRKFEDAMAKATNDQQKANAIVARDLALLNRNKEYYGDQEFNRMLINNFAIQEQIQKEPEKALDILRNNQAAKNYLLPETIQSIEEKVQPLVDERDKLEKERDSYMNLMYEADDNGDFEAYEKNEAIVNNLTEKINKIPAHLGDILSKHTEFGDGAAHVFTEGGFARIESDGKKLDFGSIEDPNEQLETLNEFIKATTKTDNKKGRDARNVLESEPLVNATSVADEMKNNDNYSNVAAVEDAVLTLNAYSDYLKNNEFYGSNEIKSFVDDMISQLKSGKEEVEKRQNSNIEKSKAAIADLQERFKNSFDHLDIEAILNNSESAEVKAIMQKKDKSIIDYISILNQLTEKERAELNAVAKELFNEAIKEFEAVSSKQLSNQLERAIGENNYNVSFNITSVLNNALLIDNSADLLNTGYVISEIRTLVNNGKVKTNNKTRTLSQLDVLENLRELEDIIYYTEGHTVDISVLNRGLNQILNSSQIIPNGQQFEALLRMIYNHPNTGSSFFLSGLAGSGKSVTIGNLVKALKAFGYENSDFVVTAKLAKIREALAEKTGIEPTSFDNINVEGKGYLIIDEAAYLSEGDIKMLENLKEQNKKLRILYVGDPNQLNEQNNTTSPMLEMVKKSKGTIKTAPALSIINRTKVLPVRDYQSRYLGANFSDSRIVGKNNNTAVTKDNKLQGVAVLNLEQAQQWFNSPMTPGAIVITDEQHFDKAQKTFGQGNVFLPNQVQGMEYDTVYIYMPTVPGSDELLARMDYSTKMYVASTRAKNAIVHITEGKVENIVQDIIPKAEDTNLTQAKEDFKTLLGKNKPHESVAKEVSIEELQEKVAEESTENPQEVIEREEEKKKEVKEEGVTETVEPVEGEKPVGAVIPTGELGKDGSVTMQKFPQEPVANKIDSAEEAEVKSPIPSDVKIAYGKTPEKSSWRLEKSFSKVLGKNKIAELVGKAIRTKKPVYGDIIVSKLKNDNGEEVINIDITIAGQKAGGVLYRPKEERDKLVKDKEALFDENHKKINEAVDELDIALGETRSIGRVKIDTVHKRGNVYKGKPSVVTQSFIEDTLIPNMNRAFFSAGTENASGKIVDYSTFLHTSPNAKGGIQDIIKKYEGDKKKQAAVSKAMDYILQNPSMAEGRPYILFLGKMNSGSYITHLVPLQPRKLRASDKIVTKLSEYLNTANSFLDIIKRDFEDIYSTDKSVAQMFAELNSVIIDNPALLTEELSNLGQQLTSLSAQVHPMLTMLANANEQIRNDKRKEKHDLTWSELINITNQFDENGNSKFVREGATFKTEEGKGLYLPIQIGSLNDLQAGITLKHDPKRAHLGSMYTTSSELDVTGASVWASSLELGENRPIVQEEQVEEETTPNVEVIETNNDTSSIERVIEDSFDDDMFFAGEKEQLTTKIGKEQAVALFKRFAPWASEEEVKFATQAMVNELTGGKSQWGRYRRNEILLATLPDGTLYKELLMHEIFHKVFAEALTGKERAALFRALAIEYPETKNMDKNEKEEFLANKFMVYQSKPQSIPQRIAHFFKKIARALGFFRANYNSIDQAFEEINQGYYKKWTKPKRVYPRYYNEIKSDFGEGTQALEAIERAEKTIAKTLAIQFKENVVSNDPGDIRDILDKTIKLFRTRYDRLVAKNNNGEELTQKETREFEFYKANGFDSKLRGFKFLLEQITGLTGLNVYTKDGVPYMSFETQDHTYMEAVEEAPEETRRKIEDNAWSKDDDFVNLEDSLTATVKLFISMVPIMGKNGKVLGVVNKKFLYKRMLDIFQDYTILGELDGKTTQKYDTLIYFLERKLEEGEKEEIKDALQMLKVMAQYAQVEQTSDFVKFISPTEAAIANKIGEDQLVPSATRMSNSELRNSEHFTILRKGKNESSISFANNVLKELNKIEDYTITQEEAGQVYLGYKSIINQDTINAIVTNFQSPYKKNLLTGYNNTSGKEARKQFEYAATFIDNLESRVKKELKQPGFFNAIKQLELEGYLDKVKEMEKSKKFTHGAVVAMYTEVFEDTAYETSEFNIADNKIDPKRKLKLLRQFLNSTIRALNVEDANVEFTSPMAKVLATHNEDNTISSVQQEGKQMYLYNNGSSATAQMRKLVNDRLSDTGFWSNNPVINMFRYKRGGLGFVQHFKLLEKATNGVDRESTYTNETTRDYLSRVINFGFVSRLLDGHSDMITWFYTISDKPKTLGLNTDILSEESKIDWIKNALDQEASIVERKGDLVSGRLIERAEKIEAGKDVMSSFHPSVNITEYRNSENKDKIIDDLIDVLYEESQGLKKELTKIGFTHDNQVVKAAENLYEIVNGQKTEMNRQQAIDYIIEEIYMQQYISKHFVNQLVVGDVNAYKNPVDLIKRMSGPFAPGTHPHFNENQKTYNVQVTQDVEFEYGPYNDPENYFELVHGEDFEVTDAQEYRSEDFKDLLSGAMGTASDIGFVDKPVFFDVNENGEPFYFKTAVITLTNQLNKMFRKAALLNEEMKSKDVQSTVTQSGTKAGNPQLNGNSTRATAAESSFDFSNATPITVNTEGQRQQLATTSTIGSSKKVTAPSQLIYLLQNNPKVNQKRAQVIYDNLAAIITSKIQKYKNQYMKDGTVDLNKMNTLLRNMTRGDETNAIIYDLLSSELGTEAFNLQGIADKMESLLLSKMYKEIQEIKFKGMKLQLVSADLFEVFDFEGKVLTHDKLTKFQQKEVEEYYQFVKANTRYEADIKLMKEYESLGRLEEFYIKFEEKEQELKEKDESYELLNIENIKRFEGKLAPRDLKYNTKDGYAEVVMPNAYAKGLGLSDGDLVSHETLSKGFGFRLPSTEMHSSMALKVVAVYDENREATPIIAPKEIVLLHGSDNDADTLNVLQYEVYKGAKPKKIGSITYKKGDIFGKVKGFAEEIANIDKAIANSDKPGTLLDIKEEIHKNQIVEEFMMTVNTVETPKNKKDMLEPISFGPVVKKEHENNEQLAIDTKDYKERGIKFINDPNIETFRKLNVISGKVVTESKGSPNSITNDLAFMKANNEGKELVGFYANGGKTVYMNISEDGKTKMSKLDKPITLFGTTFQNFEDFEKFGKQKGIKVSLLHDIYVNLATDNAKEQRLDVLNQNKFTASIAVLQTRLGVPMIYQAIMALSPGVRALTEVYKDSTSINPGKLTIKGKEIKGFNKNSQYSEVMEALTGVEGYEPSGKVSLQEAISIHGKDIESLTKEEALIAAEVLASFHKFEALAEEMRNVMKATSGMNSSHKNLSSIDNSLEAFDKLEDKSFPFQNALGEVKHIKAHKEYLQFTRDLIEGTLLFKSREFRQMIDKLMREFRIDRTSDRQVAQFKADVEQFLIASMPSLEQYKDGQFRSKGDVLYTTDAFLQNFTNEFIAFRTQQKAHDLPKVTRKYLSKISTASKFIAGKKKGDFTKLTFDGRSLKGIDVEKAKLGVSHIIDNFKEIGEKLKAYMTLEYGLRIMNNSFTRFMPIESFKDAVNFLTNNGREMLSDFTDTETYSPQLFAIQYLTNNFKANPYVSKPDMMGPVAMVKGNNLKPAFKKGKEIFTLAKEQNGVGFYLKAEKTEDTSYDLSQLGENLDTRHALTIPHHTVGSFKDMTIPTAAKGKIAGVSIEGQPLRKGEKYVQFTDNSGKFEEISVEVVREAIQSEEKAFLEKHAPEKKNNKENEEYVKGKEQAEELAKTCNTK